MGMMAYLVTRRWSSPSSPSKKKILIVVETACSNLSGLMSSSLTFILILIAMTLHHECIVSSWFFLIPGLWEGIEYIYPPALVF